MKKIFNLITNLITNLNSNIDKIIKPYALIYFIILQLSTIILLSYQSILSSPTIPDAILCVIGIILIYLFFNIFLLIPVIFTIALSEIISFFMSISIPLFLFLSFFEIIGSQTIDILQYGFFKILIICILMTPIGYLNLKSLKVFENWIS